MLALMSERTSPVPEPPAHRRRLQRWLVRLSIFFLLVLSVVGALMVSLQMAPVRRGLVDWVDGRLGEAAGLHLTVEDVSLSWRAGRLEVFGLTLSSVGEAPFLRIDRVEARWHWSGLRDGGVWRFEEVTVERPVFDLHAPLPQGDGESDGAGKVPLTIAELRIEDGTVEGKEFVQQGWLAGLRAEDVDFAGTLDSGEVTTKKLDTRLWLHRSDGAPPVPLDIAARLHGPLAGPWQVEELRATGDGLELSAEGEIDRGAERLPVRFELVSEPARLLPDLATEAGKVEARGELELRGVEGNLQLQAERFPPDLLAPFLGEDLLRRFRADGTHLDLEATLRVAGWKAGTVAGKAEAFWRRGGETLLQAEFDLPDDKEELRGTFEVNLLPAEAGTRRLTGHLHWPEGEDAAAAQLRDTKLQLTGKDLRATLGRLESRWPELLPPLSLHTPAQRAFALQAEFSGPLLDPEASLQMTLGAATATAPPLKLVADGRPRSLSGTARLELTRFELASLALEGLAGRLEGVVDVTGASNSWQGSADLLMRDLQTGSTAPTWEEVRLSSTLEGDRLRLGELVGHAGDLEVRATGGVTLEQPVREAWLDLEAEHPSTGLRRVKSNAVISEGVLRLADTTFETDAGHGRLTGIVPLANLERIDALRELLSNQPLFLARGAMELRLEAEDVRGTALAEMLGSEPPSFDLISDLEAELTVDLFRPQDATGWWQVGPASVDLQGIGPGTETQTVAEVDTGLISEMGAETDTDLDPGASTEESAATVTETPLRFEWDSGALRGTLAEGVLTVQGRPIRSTFGDLALALEVPMRLLPGWPTDPATAAGGEPGTAAESDLISAQVSWPGFDSHALAAALGQDDFGLRLLGDLDLDLRMNPNDLPASRGTVRIESLRFETGQDQVLVAKDTVTIDLTGGRLTLKPARVGAQVSAIGRRDLVMSGGLQLVGLPQDLTQLAELSELRLEDFQAHAEGFLPGSLLTPYMGGGRVSGQAEVVLDLSGPFDALEATLRVAAPEMKILLLEPYTTEIRALKFNARAEGGAWTFEEGQAQVNQGRLDFSGRYLPTTGLELEGFLDTLRYRLDYGLNILLSGNFDLSWPAEGAPRLGANLLVERGVLRRDLQLDREILDALFGPPQIPGVSAGDDFDLELDISIATVDGLRIRNNLADLHATWSPITVTGSSSRPVVLGGIDIERGGRIFALGQTAQIDQASLTFHGIPGAAPEVEIETSNTLETSPLGRYGANDVLTAGELRGGVQAQNQVDLGQALTTGLETYYGDRLANLLGNSLGETRISFRPLLIFGETDPEPRLTLSRDLSPELSFAVAVSLRETETRTYLVDLHDLSFLPGFAAQAFTNDDDNTGATALKTFDFGGGPAADDGRPRLREIVFENPEALEEKSLSRRDLRRSLAFSRGDRLPEDVEFEVELDLAQALERRGFPDAQVEVLGEGVGTQGEDVRLRLKIEPGPKVEVLFLGDRPARGLRRSIAALYHPGFGEEAALEDMRRRSVEIFRGLGHPAPQVEVRLENEDDPQSGEDRRVLVEIEAGERLKLQEPVFEGVSPEISEQLATSFTSTLERVELVLATPAADARLISTLRRLAFAEGKIISRSLDEDQRRLTVVLEPGPRRRLAAVRLVGLEDEVRERLQPTLPVKVGDPARSDLIAGAAVLVESDLRQRGFTRARVRPRLRAVPDDSNSYELELITEPGDRLRVNEVHVRGQLATRDSWIRRVADLEEGSLLRTQDLAIARRRLLQTGVFSRVQVDTVPKSLSGEDLPGTNSPTDIFFDLEENPRFSVATGLRWVSSEGLGVVVDLLDRNVLGRGTTVGLRTRYAEDDRSLRLYSVVPRLLAGPNDLELFAQERQRTTENERIDTLDLAFQFSRSFGEHWRRRIYGRFQEEERQATSGGPVTNSSTPLFGLQLIYGHQQVAELEPRGIFGSVDLSGTHDSLGGEQNAWRVFGQVNSYRPFRVAGRRFTWGQSFRVGWADAADEPLRDDLRFRAGGELSIRGYGTGTLGPPPAVEGDEAPGGEALLVFNQELRFRLRDDLQGLLFFDVGNVWDDPEDFGSDLARSLGVGMRASTPIGLIRLDLAVPLDRRKEDEGLEVYIGFGNIF